MLASSRHKTSLPSSFTEVFFTIARPRLLTTVQLASVPLCLRSVMLKATRAIPGMMTSLAPRFRNRTVRIWFALILLGLLVTTMLWWMSFTPNEMRAERNGSGLLPYVVMLNSYSCMLVQNGRRRLWRLHSIAQYMRLLEPTTKIWMKIDLHYHWQKCRLGTVVCGSIRFVHRSSLESGIKRQWVFVKISVLRVIMFSELLYSISLYNNVGQYQRCYIVIWSPSSVFHLPENTRSWMAILH